MANVHNSFIRGLNCIYLQAPHVHETKDKEDFLKFISFWCGFVHHHHNVEEEMVFPQIEQLTGKKSLMNSNIEQHKIFEPGLLKLDEYATTTTAVGYDATKVRSMIDGFADALYDHLKAEIPTLLALQSESSDALLKMQKECEAAGFKQANVSPPHSTKYTSYSRA
jgi:hemerythrin-like domain-containing protein